MSRIRGFSLGDVSDSRRGLRGLGLRHSWASAWASNCWAHVRLIHGPTIFITQLLGILFSLKSLLHVQDIQENLISINQLMINYTLPIKLYPFFYSTFDNVPQQNLFFIAM
jgi:hypothetical protein